MEQIQLANGLPKETVIAIKMLSKNTKAMICPTDGDTKFSNITAEICQKKRYINTIVNNVSRLHITNVNRSNKRKSFHIKKDNDILQNPSHMQTTQMI